MFHEVVASVMRDRWRKHDVSGPSETQQIAKSLNAQ